MGEGAMFLSAQSAFSTPNSMSGETYTATLTVPVNLKQGLVTSSPELKRLQQDLLILTSFNDNSTLHWRPLWFDQADQFTECFWTLHNPPNVVTELLPFRALGRPVTTRRMRRRDDPPALYIKSWEHWYRYCELYGIPVDFLCEEQVALMRLGLPEFSNGKLCELSTYPLYPEPQPLGQGRYYLDREMYRNLPRKFQGLNLDEAVIVQSNGALDVAQSELSYFHASQWTHYSGRGRYTDDYWYTADDDISNLKVQGAGRRWAYLPWTKEQEASCRPMKLRLRMSSQRDLKASKIKVGPKAKGKNLQVDGTIAQQSSGVKGDKKTKHQRNQAAQGRNHGLGAKDRDDMEEKEKEIDEDGECELEDEDEGEDEDEYMEDVED